MKKAHKKIQFTGKYNIIFAISDFVISAPCSGILNIGIIDSSGYALVLQTTIMRNVCVILFVR